MIKSNKSIYYNKIFIIFCILVCIYNSGYALSTIYTFGMYLDIFFAYLFLMPIMFVFLKEKLNILLSSFLLLIFMIIATFFISRFSSPHIYISLICKIIFSFGIVLVYEFDNVIKIFSKIMVFVSITSLVGYCLLNYLRILSLPIMNSANNVSYGVGYIFFYITYIPQRNCGIFWEPGIFASFLTIAIIFETMYKKDKKSIFRVLLFIITIITTKSTAAYGLLLFVFFYLVMNKLNASSDKIIIYIVIFMIFIILIMIFYNYSSIIIKLGLTSNPVINRLVIENLKNESRFMSIIHNLKMFTKRPIFGWGFRYAYEKVEHVADISTSTFLLNVFGIFGFQYTFLWIYGILKNKKANIFVNLTILIIFIMILNKESHTSFIFSWCIFFYFIKNTLSIKDRLHGLLNENV